MKKVIFAIALLLGMSFTNVFAGEDNPVNLEITNTGATMKIVVGN
jgi:hypothetical protein